MTPHQPRDCASSVAVTMQGDQAERAIFVDLVPEFRSVNPIQRCERFVVGRGRIEFFDFAKRIVRPH
jgi:hypothetical protein